MAPRRCICGRSAHLPLCDGSHAAEGWSCETLPAARHPRIYAAGPHHHTVADRLAHARRGGALHRLRGPVEAELLVIITDGADLDDLAPALARVRAERRRVVVLGADPALVGAAFPGASVVWVPQADHPAVLWRQLVAALDQPEQARASTPAPTVFLSHATADETRLQPAIEALRRVGVSVFSCGDSIPGGTRWWDHIRAALHAADRFVLVLSPAARASTWCAFEAGAAMAWDKPIQLVSLDGAPPPSFLAHLQMQDVGRIQALRPWLTADEALIEALLAPLSRSPTPG